MANKTQPSEFQKGTALSYALSQGCALAILKRKGTGEIGCTIHCGGIEAHWIQDIQNDT